MPWNYHVMLLVVTCNGPGSTMAQQLRRVLSSPLVPMEPYTEVTLRMHRVDITSVLSGTLLLESRYSAGRYRLLLRVRSHFSIFGISSWTDRNKKNNKAHSLRKHPFLLALRRWGRFVWRNVCDSATEISYWWRKICPESGQKRWLVDGVVTLF